MGCGGCSRSIEPIVSIEEIQENLNPRFRDEALHLMEEEIERTKQKMYTKDAYMSRWEIEGYPKECQDLALRAWAVFDTDQDGCLREDEFISALFLCICEEIRLESILLFTFRLLDQNFDDRIDEGDLMHMYFEQLIFVETIRCVGLWSSQKKKNDIVKMIDDSREFYLREAASQAKYMMEKLGSDGFITVDQWISQSVLSREGFLAVDQFRASLAPGNPNAFDLGSSAAAAAADTENGLLYPLGGACNFAVRRSLLSGH